MKKTLTLVIMALAALLTQCRKPAVEIPSPAAPEGTTVSMTVTAGSGAKTDITSMGVIKWSAGDRLYVGDGSKYIGYLTLVSGDGTPTGTFSGDVTLTGIAEGSSKDFGFFYLGSGDYRTSLENNAAAVEIDFSSQDIYAEDGELKNASAYHVGYGTASGTVKNGIVTGINVTLVSKVAIARFSFKNGGAEYTGPLRLSGANICNKMRVDFNSSTFDFSGTEGDITLNGGHGERYVMLVPTGTAGQQTLTFTGYSVASITSDTEPLNGVIEANKFYGRDVAMVVNVTPSVFSVGVGATVEFAPGNLYYDGATDEWKFEANQWDFRTYNGNGSCINGVYNKESGTPAGDWGLFGWSSTDHDDYGMIASGDNSDYSGTEFKDWGKIEGLPSAGEGEQWRTLTANEWEHLLSKRDGAAGLYAWVSLKITEASSISGLVILPDDSQYAPNQIDDIASLYESGAVFLPASGYGQGAKVEAANDYGRYWTATPSANNPTTHARYFHFPAFSLPQGVGDNVRNYMSAVRLAVN